MISLGIAVTVVGLVLLIGMGFRTLAKGIKDIDEAEKKDKEEGL